MSKKFLMLFIASIAVAAVYVSDLRAGELNKLEHDQVGDSARPDVDPNASTGGDASIVKQEDEQIGDSAEPDVDPNASQGQDESIVKQEQNQIPH